MSKKKPIGLIKQAGNNDGIWLTSDGRYKVYRTYARAYTRGPFKSFYDLHFNGAAISMGIPSLKEVRGEIERHMGPNASPTLNRI